MRDDDLDRYLDELGECPEPGRLADRVRADHPDWHDLDLWEYVRRIYERSASRIRAETDARRRQARPDGKPTQPPTKRRRVAVKREPLLTYGRAEVRGERYDSLDTTRPIRLGGQTHPENATFVPRPMNGSGGHAYPWTVLHVREDIPRDENGCWTLKIVGGATQRQIDELRRLDRLDRSPGDRAVIERLGAWDESWPATLAVVTIAVPAAAIRAGDVLMRADYAYEQPERIRGCWFGLSLGDYATLRDAVREAGENALRDITPWYVPSHRCTVQSFVQDTRKWGRRLKEWHSRLFVVRPFDHAVSVPIHAASDDAAIFDLITDVGCRMPIG